MSVDDIREQVNVLRNLCRDDSAGQEHAHQGNANLHAIREAVRRKAAQERKNHETYGWRKTDAETATSVVAHLARLLNYDLEHLPKGISEQAKRWINNNVPVRELAEGP